MAQLLPYRNFDTTLAEARRRLEADGVAVIPNVLGEAGVRAMQDGMWALLRSLTAEMDRPIRADHPQSWKTYAALHPMHGMMLQGYGVGHSAVAWDVRQHPAVAEAFAAVWACHPGDLVASFDGLSINFPPEIVEDGWHVNDWFHVDQSYCRPGFECVQGLVTAYDVMPGDATLSVLVGSHRQGPALTAAHPELLGNKGDWVMLREEHLAFMRAQGCERANVQCTAGSLVLWDSRTVHCGCLPQPGRAQQSMRFVTYVCQIPRALVSEDALARKRTQFKRKDMTSHWPDGRRVFKGRDKVAVPGVPHATVTPFGRRLAGFE
eukprot:m.43023 g.43023  ORF g.43023 m.43023 type:complete len:321 (+) comp5755_c0_seq1:99-1061(+)